MCATPAITARRRRASSGIFHLKVMPIESRCTPATARKCRLSRSARSPDRCCCCYMERAGTLATRTLKFNCLFESCDTKVLGCIQINSVSNVCNGYESCVTHRIALCRMACLHANKQIPFCLFPALPFLDSTCACRKQQIRSEIDLADHSVVAAFISRKSSKSKNSDCFHG